MYIESFKSIAMFGVLYNIAMYVESHKIPMCGESCKNMRLLCVVANPWEVTDSARCNDLCDMNAYCAKLVPRLEFQCVCKAGYEGNGKSCGGRLLSV